MLVFGDRCDNCNGTAMIDVKLVEGERHVGCPKCGVIEDITKDVARFMLVCLGKPVPAHLKK